MNSDSLDNFTKSSFANSEDDESPNQLPIESQDDLAEPSRIHHLYQDLYVTDLKADLNSTHMNLQRTNHRAM